MLIIENAEIFEEFVTMIYVLSAADKPELLTSDEEFNCQKEALTPRNYPAVVIFDHAKPCVTLSDISFVYQEDIRGSILGVGHNITGSYDYAQC